MRIRSAARALLRRIAPPKPKPLILMYHRIAENPVDYWGLAVSPARFDQQLQVLRRTRYPLPLTQFVRDLVAGTLRSDAVALTFDDGYADNLSAAKPRLADAGVPATVFLATGYIDRHEAYWWDELTRLMLLSPGPACFELIVRGNPMRINLGPASPAGTAPARQRTAELMAMWEALRRLEDLERRSIMAELRSILPTHDRIDDGRAMTGAEVQRLVNDGLVTIGAHTVTHPVLSELSDSDCAREIAGSMHACELLAGAPAVGFSYPYGAFSPNTRNAVVATGFHFACSSLHGPASKACDLFALPRINVHNWDGDAFEHSLRSASSLN